MCPLYVLCVMLYLSCFMCLALCVMIYVSSLCVMLDRLFYKEHLSISLSFSIFFPLSLLIYGRFFLVYSDNSKKGFGDHLRIAGKKFFRIFHVSLTIFTFRVKLSDSIFFLLDLSPIVKLI